MKNENGVLFNESTRLKKWDKWSFVESQKFLFKDFYMFSRI